MNLLWVAAALRVPFWLWLWLCVRDLVVVCRGRRLDGKVAFPAAAAIPGEQEVGTFLLQHVPLGSTGECRRWVIRSAGVRTTQLRSPMYGSGCLSLASSASACSNIDASARGSCTFLAQRASQMRPEARRTQRRYRLLSNCARILSARQRQMSRWTTQSRSFLSMRLYSDLT